MGKLDGKVALVTGSGRNIGRATVLKLAGEGAHVVVNARSNQAEADAVAREARDRGVKALAVIADVAKKDQVDAMVTKAMSEFGRIDILINNAGTNIRKSLHEYTLDEWHRVIDTNLTSAFLCSRAVYPAMKSVGGGKVINIGSMMSIFGASFSPAYGASKGGIVQLTKSAAIAWAPDNIQVNAVLPGWIDTELTQGARREVPWLHESVLKRTPARRWGTIDDMAGVAVFLASSASDFVTGTFIPVDGGYSIQG